MKGSEHGLTVPQVYCLEKVLGYGSRRENQGEIEMKFCGINPGEILWKTAMAKAHSRRNR